MEVPAVLERNDFQTLVFVSTPDKTGVSDEELKNLFARYGSVRSFYKLGKRPGSSFDLACVDFLNLHEAAEAIKQLNGYKLGCNEGEEISCSFANEATKQTKNKHKKPKKYYKKLNNTAHRQNVSESGISTSVASNDSSSPDSSLSYSTSQIESRVDFVRSNVLYVRNIGLTIQENQLLDLFRLYRIQHCKILKDEKGDSKGQAFIFFDTADDAFNAYEVSKDHPPLHLSVDLTNPIVIELFEPLSEIKRRIIPEDNPVSSPNYTFGSSYCDFEKLIGEYEKLLEFPVQPKRCYFFSRNLCHNGEDCPFFHDPNYDQKEKKRRRKEAIMLRKKEALQKLQMEEHMRLMEKSLRGPCFYFEHAYCLKGDNCPFLHRDPHQIVSMPQLVSEEVLSNPLCGLSGSNGNDRVSGEAAVPDVKVPETLDSEQENRILKDLNSFKESNQYQTDIHQKPHFNHSGRRQRDQKENKNPSNNSNITNNQNLNYPCYFFTYSVCQKGNSCPYLHQNQYRNMPPRQQKLRHQHHQQHHQPQHQQPQHQQQHQQHILPSHVQQYQSQVPHPLLGSIMPSQFNYYQPPAMRQGFPPVPYFSPQPVMGYDAQLHRDRLFHMSNGNREYYPPSLVPSPDLMSEQRNLASFRAIEEMKDSKYLSDSEDSDDSTSSDSALEIEKIQQRMAVLGREAIVLERKLKQIESDEKKPIVDNSPNDEYVQVNMDEEQFSNEEGQSKENDYQNNGRNGKRSGKNLNNSSSKTSAKSRFRSNKQHQNYNSNRPNYPRSQEQPQSYGNANYYSQPKTHMRTIQRRTSTPLDMV